MTQIHQLSLRNHLLAGIPLEAFEALRPGLEPLEMRRGMVLVDPDVPCEWAVFPESGLISVVSQMASGHQVEIGLFGRDGMSCTATVLGARSTPLRAFVQIPGDGHRVSTTVLRRAMTEHPELHATLMLYVQVFTVQVSQTSLSNACCTIEQRLARWLLMCHDRTSGDHVAITHELLSIVLGVRRTGVTLAMHMLEGERMICARRGGITVLDRDKLQQRAGQGYGLAEREYDSLLGSHPTLAQAV